MTDEVNTDLDQLAANDIPISAYHFDGTAWGAAPCTWGLGAPLIDRLRGAHVRALLHFWGGVPFDGSFTGGCVSPATDETAHAALGDVLGGFYLDEGATDELARTTIAWVEQTLGAQGEVVMKGYQSDQGETDAGLGAYGHSCYVNDLPSDFPGLKAGIERVFSLAATLPAPFNEFTGYDFVARPDEETFYRRIHFGAMQMVMDHSPWMAASPWLPDYSPALLEDYRNFAWLHTELVPYLHSYDYAAYENGGAIFREPDAAAFTTKLGEELFVAYVTDRGQAELAIALPDGEWLDYWNTSRAFTGPTTVQQPVPLGREPIFIKRGAMLPMNVSRDYTGHGTRASRGSLTVVVYPKDTSAFRYRDDGLDKWISLAAKVDGAALTLGASESPSQPILFRVEGWPAAPASVSVCGAIVKVNQGGSTPSTTSEDAVNGSVTSAWYYDQASHRLIIKTEP